MKRILFLGIAALLAQVAACGGSNSSSSSQSTGNSGNSSGNSGNSSGVTGDNSGNGNSSGDSGDVTPPPDGDTGGGNQACTMPPDAAQYPSQSNATISTVTLGKGYYILAVPANYNAAKSYPLVLVLHGDDDTAEMISQWYPFHAATEASGEDAFVVYPSGPPPDRVGDGWQLWPLDPGNSDIVFLQAVIDDVSGNYNIDSNRVFGAGYSKGAFMVNQVACVTTMFRAIAGNSGGAPSLNGQGGDQDVPTFCNPVAAFVMQGVDDNAVGLPGGIWEAQFWAERNGCKDDWNDSEIPGDYGDALWKDFDCPTAYPVRLGVMPCTDHRAMSPVPAWAFFQDVMKNLP